jgi:hypothetical protein
LRTMPLSKYAILRSKESKPLASFAIMVLRVVIPGVRRPFGGRTGRAGGPVHYALYEPGGVL